MTFKQMAIELIKAVPNNSIKVEYTENWVMVWDHTDEDNLVSFNIYCCRNDADNTRIFEEALEYLRRYDE